MKIDWEVAVNSRAIAKIIGRIKDMMFAAAYEAAVEMLRELVPELQKIYQEVIDQFYEDYTPEEGLYERQENLRKLLVTQTKDESANWGFDPDKNTPFERGGGHMAAYEHVFRQGWHGGATGTDKHGYTVRTPSWRSPYPYYSTWGKVAQQAPRAPLDAWNEEIEAYKADVLPYRYNALYKKHLQKFGFKVK